MNHWILGELKARMFEPGAIMRFRDRFHAAVEKASVSTTSPHADLDREIFNSEKAVANLTEALARLGFSDAVGLKLRPEEARPHTLRARRPEVEGERARTPTIPTEQHIKAYLTGMFRAFEEDPEKARAMLAAHF